MVSISAIYHSRFISSIFSFHELNSEIIDERPLKVLVIPPTISPDHICAMPVPISIAPSQKVRISFIEFLKLSPNTEPRDSPQPRMVLVTSFPFALRSLSAPDTSPPSLMALLSSDHEVLKAAKGLFFSSCFLISCTCLSIRRYSSTVILTAFFTNLPSASFTGMVISTPSPSTFAFSRVSFACA